MKCGIYLLAVLVLCAAFCGYSKSVTEDNYVRTWVYLDNTGNDSRARISTDPGVDANGDTIVKNINRYKSVSHTYLGSFDYDGYYSGFRIVTPVGLYDSKAKKHYWNITNHQGSVMAVVDSDGKVAQRSGLYPSGTPFTLPVDFAADSVTMRAGAIDERLHIGNRWLSHSGLNWYDSTARMHDPLLCRFTTPDPLATDYTSSSPWTHCLANPANILDPTGCANIYNKNGYVGSDGIDDNKKYIIPDEATSSYKENSKIVPTAGYSKNFTKTITDFVKTNSGNTDAFLDDSDIYNCLVELPGNNESIKAMAKEASKDDAKNKTNAENNREYGGYFENGKFVPEKPGLVSKASEGGASISMRQNVNSMHTHPSGADNEWTYVQHPSITDITNKPDDKTHYVIGRGDKNMYIYNRSGIVAKVKYDVFLNFFK